MKDNPHCRKQRLADKNVAEDRRHETESSREEIFLGPPQDGEYILQIWCKPPRRQLHQMNNSCIYRYINVMALMQEAQVGGLVVGCHWLQFAVQRRNDKTLDILMSKIKLALWNPMALISRSSLTITSPSFSTILFFFSYLELGN